MRPINFIVLHHSLTVDGATLSWDDIVRYHTSALPAGHGWSDVGYHIGIERVEDSMVKLLGRPWTLPGAHAVGRNHDSLGVCLVGNFDLAPPSSAIWHTAQHLVRWLLEYFTLPVARVVGHREVQEGRTCPGTHFNLDQFREDLST